jgi:hypothetical protein
MIEWLREQSLPTRVLVYTMGAILAFAVAAGVGATTALMIQGELSLPAREEPEPAGEQGDTPQHGGADGDRPQQKEAGAEQEEAASNQDETEYVSRVGEIQASAVETFMDSHDLILRYDAVTADDVEEMQANETDIQGFADQVDELDPPQRYGEQYEVLRSAINELHEAAQLAYSLAADPTAATQSGFDEYDRHVNEAAAGLQRSNEILGRDYKTIEGVQRVSPLS